MVEPNHPPSEHQPQPPAGWGDQVRPVGQPPSTEGGQAAPPPVPAVPPARGAASAPPPLPPPPVRPPAYQPPGPRKGRHGCLIAVLIVLILFISFVTLLSGALNHMPGLSAIGESVALLEVEGPILDTRRHLEFVQQFEQKSNWKAMVIRIESPGGASAVTQELFSEIQRVKNETGKPVIVSMGNTAASGGYYLALAGDKLYATPSTITGSVGVILSIPNLEELFDKIGYQPRTVKSGEFKDLGDVGREWTPREKALLQGLIDNVFTQFFNDVVTQRRAAIMQALQSEPALREEFPDLNDVLSDDSPTTDPVRWFARQICDGRVITGEQALRYGFVDALGGLPDALREAERRAGLKHPANVISSKKAPTLMDLLSGNVRSMLDALGPRHPTLQFRWTLP